MLICDEPTVRSSGGSGGFNIFFVTCTVDTGNITDPDSTVGKPWADCEINDFVHSLKKQILQYKLKKILVNTLYEFPGNIDGQSVSVETGTYQITEETTTPLQGCANANYENVQIQIVDGSQTQNLPLTHFCFTIEGDDCSGTIQAGEEKTCTIKNYFTAGNFAVPQTG